MTTKALKKSFDFIKKEAVLCISAILALISCFIVRPDSDYLSYIDWDTLALLFSLMAVTGKLQKDGFFIYTANLLLKKTGNDRTLLFIMVFLPFVFSMLATNDVALITFVPFGLVTLRAAGRERLAVVQTVLQTAAANLGSMLTPMGNPQNLYLYGKSGAGFFEFCSLTLPYVLASGIILAVVTAFRKPVKISRPAANIPQIKPAGAICCAAGFVLCLSAVFKLIPAIAAAAAVLIYLLIKDRKLLAKIDYSLLGTFFALFIFIGNISRIESVQIFLENALEGRVVLVSALLSQIISNVPAAILLSGFTNDIENLIIGCNLGGLGTLIASMASLISYKAVSKEYPHERKRYLKQFTFYNILLLGLLCLLYLIIGK